MATALPAASDLTGGSVTESDFKAALTAMLAALREGGDPLGVFSNIRNLGLSFSVGSNALTCAVKQRDGSTNATAINVISVPFRNSSASNGSFNVRLITGALSLVISSGSTLGHANNVASPIYWYLIDNAGTVELAASSKYFGLQGIVSTTAEGGAGAADSATVMYSATARSNVPFVCIGRTIDTQTTAGTWTVVPSDAKLSQFSPSVLRLATHITAAGSDMPLSFEGDEDTGLFSPAPNTIAACCNGTEIWRAATTGLSLPVCAAVPNTASNAVPTAAIMQNSMLGGFINKFINGTFDVWQEKTSGTITTAGGYSADGWIITPTGASCTFAQGAPGQNCRFALQIIGATGVTNITVKQRIESYLASSLNSQQITVQGWIYNNTGGGFTPTLTVKHANAADNWSASTTDVNAVSLQPVSAAVGWYQFAYTFLSQSVSGNGLEVILDLGNNFSSAAKNVYISSFDIRATPGVTTGLNSTPPLPELRPYPIEFVLCQRYWRKSYNLGITPGNPSGAGSMSQIASGPSGGIIELTSNFSTPMRAAPTVTIYDGAGTSGKLSYYNGSWNNNGTITVTSAYENSLAVAIGGIASTTQINFEYVANSRL